MVTSLRRLLQLSFVATAAFAASLTLEAPQAKAVVYCAAGVYRAGCVARPVYGAARGVYAPARGVARRTTRRVVRRNSDIMLKEDVVLLGRLHNGLGFYRFHYKGDNQLFVGVIAQEVQMVLPNAVTRGSDGFLMEAIEP